MFKQLIFDCDGVLVDTEIVAAEVMTSTFAQFDLNITVEEYITKYTGKTISTLFKSLLTPAQLHSIDLQALVHQCDVDIYNQLRPVKGVSEFIPQLKIPVAVVSNSSLWQVEKAIEYLQLNDVVKGKFSAEMVENPKPAPDVYLHAAHVLGVRPEECLVVEDSLSGVHAASTAGMTVIGFTGASHIQDGHEHKLIEKGANYIASNATALNQLIQELL